MFRKMIKHFINLLLKGGLRRQWVYLIHIVVVLNLLLVWFKDNKIIAGAEEGIPLYSAERTLGFATGIWHEIDLGFSSPLYLTKVPVLYVASVLQKFGLEAWVVQLGLFGFILLSALIFFEKVTRLLLPQEARIVAFLASFFYLFNLFTMSQVWARFIYPLFFLWALVPVFLYCWILWMRTPKIRYLLGIVVTSLVYSYANLVISPIFVIWGLAFAYLLTFELKKGRLLRMASLFLLGLVVWILANSWWLIPTVLTQGGTLSLVNNANANLVSLREVSKYFPTNLIFLLQQSFYFGDSGFWRDYYATSQINNLSFLVLVFVVVGAFTVKKSSGKYFLVIVLICGWFLSKGFNEPFGKEFFTFIFNTFPISQVLRNPYEKAGIIFVFPYAILFAIGLKTAAGRFKKFTVPIILVASYLCFYVLVRPYWDGSIFKGYYVEVPKYYEDSNAILTGQGVEFRVLHMPYSRTGNASYIWGFFGPDMFESLFDNPSFPKMSLQSTEDFYQSIPRYFSNPNFTNILKITSSCCVVLHEDIIIDANFQESVDYSRELILKWENVVNEGEEGALEIFTLSPESRLPRVYLAQSLVRTEGLGDALEAIVSEEFNPKSEAYFVVSQNQSGYIPVNSSHLPNYTVTKINNSHYRLSIRDAQEPFVVILSNNFNTLWKAYSKESEAKVPFEVNGFANGWVFDQKGSYNIEIVFSILKES